MSLHGMRARQFSLHSPNSYGDWVSVVYDTYGRSAFLALNYITVMVSSIEHLDGLKTVGIAVLV